ncbi:hypothetical protein GUY61_37300 [Streptomyces sp. GC420]|nr:hypothetical protein [Streptomyces sp. GC420]
MPADLNDTLARALAADPADRLSDAGAFRDALASVDLDTVHLGGFGPVPGAASAPGRPDAPPAPNPPHAPGAPHGTVVAPLPPVGDAAPPATSSPERPGEAGGTTAVPRTDERRRKGPRPRLVAVLAAVAVSVTVAVGVVVYQEQPWNGGPGSSPTTTAGADGGGEQASARPSAFGGVPTTTEDCPATEVEGVGGRCTETAECWSGITDISGIITVSRADCQTRHVWETFAIAPLPEDGMTNNARDLIKHPDVKALCSQEVMAKSRTAEGDGIAAEWNVDIVPPSAADWAGGHRFFRCVAAAVTDDGQKTGNHFRPRA